MFVLLVSRLVVSGVNEVVGWISRGNSELRGLEDEIVSVRKELTDQGLDAGAQTIAVHLDRRHGDAAIPSVATIWRILSRRGFVSPQPQKRPRSSFVRFEAQMPNERWQADITHVRLASGTEVEILNVIDTTRGC